MLEPTFWRTCRVLEGEKRLECLRKVLETPGQSVQEIAKALALREDEASRALRALQSRGLIQGTPFGRMVRYVPVANEAVHSAVALLGTMQRMLKRKTLTEPEMHRQMKAFRHTRRLKIMSALAARPLSLDELQCRTGISRCALYRHLTLLADLGHVVLDGNTKLYRLSRPKHAFGRRLRALWFRR